MPFDSSPFKSSIRLYAGLAALLVVLGVGWSGLWSYAAGRVERELDLLAARETGFGRQWSCADRKIDGFPFAIVAHCAHLSVRGSGLAGEDEIAASAAGASAEASVLAPDDLVLTLARPLTLTGPGMGAASGVSVDWSDLRANLHGVLAQRDRGDLSIRDLVVSASGADQQIAAANVEAKMRLVAPDGGGVPDGEIEARIDGLRAPAFDDLLQSDKLLRIAFAARASKVDLAGARDFPQFVESWRQAGGALAISSFDVSNGQFVLRGNGAMRLDANHRPSGRVALSASGADPMLARLGAPVGLLRNKGLLGALLGGGAAARGNADQLSFTLSCDAGHLLIGQFPMPLICPPLY